MKKLILACVLVSAGCDVKRTSTAPSEFETMSSAAVTAESSVVMQQTGSLALCPAVPPFTTVVDVVIVGGAVNVFVNEIAFRFVDQRGAQMPQVTIPAPLMTTQFGTALVAARSARTFPVTVRFGCGTGPTGTILMTVQTIDVNGRGAVQNLNVNVR